ncbi:recombinase family protein [Nocardia sp. CDC159]|uniref:Recombinase family protein n=1 Tax=Nocardia pulmonis TaxID=2951408 RepID=A0A9X2IYZ8_9NOCA|nr:MULTISPECIES: recombinase family protein [Nocardia]MCM6776229.1 recombinase family protein [Nocardia pulmonis]MCM6788445.1 recombinase family protein [Nocardia sp. CDC159]
MTTRVVAERRERVEAAAKLRVVLYCRKSGPGDKSVADQERVGRRDVASQGGVVVAVFTDNLSASRYRRVQERPGFIKTTEFIRGGHAEMLWTFANNRAHRDLDDYVPLRRICIDTGTLWRYGGRTYDLSKASDRRAANADALRAEEQSDDISDNVNRGIQLALEDGRAHGKLLRGYRIVRDPDSGKALYREPIPEQAALLNEAADRVLAGESLRSVSADFIPRWKAIGGKGFFDQAVLARVLVNPTYAGLRTHKGEVIREGTWEPIFTREKHEKLRALLKDPKRRTHHRGTAPIHLVSYIATCGECGKAVAPKLPRRKDGKAYAPSYRCVDGHVGRRIDLVDEHVHALIIALLERPETAAKLNAREEDEQDVIDTELAKIEQLRADSDAFVKGMAKADLPPDTKARMVASYVAEIEDQIKVAQDRIDALVAAADPLLRDLAGPGAGDRWRKRTLEQQREIIRRYLRIKIMPVARVGRFGELGVEVHPLAAMA